MKLLSDLIHISSVSGKEEQIAKYLINYFIKIGLKVIHQDGNVIVHIPGKNSLHALIFNAHMDTVSAGDLSLWEYAPDSGVGKNGKIYGLGASDDKGGVATLCLLADELKKLPPECDAWITFVTKEETDGFGTQSFLKYFLKRYEKKYSNIAAVIAESTNAESIEIGHRGSYFVEIETKGESGHAARPAEVKAQAIEEMLVVIATIKKLEKELQKKCADKYLGVPTFVITGIESNANSANKIPSSCKTTLDIRTTPKLHNKLLGILQQTVEHKAKIKVLFTPSPYSYTLPEEKIVSLFKNVMPSVKIKVSPTSNDMGFFTQVGIPAVTFGPGIKEVIHKENEYIEVKNIEKTLDVYKKIITLF